MTELREELAYWQVRTSEDARKKVAELTKEIDEEEHKREVDLRRQNLEDKKRKAQDGIRTIEKQAKEEKEEWEKTYSEVEVVFDEHSINMIALASTMSKGMYEEFEKNYLTPLDNALRNRDYGYVGGILDGVNDFAEDAYDKTYNSKNSQAHRLASSILALKKQYEYGNDKSAHERALPLYSQLEKLKPDIANNLRNMFYQQAQEYVKNLPKMHKGGKTLSYGAVYMKPGELTFPP